MSAMCVDTEEDLVYIGDCFSAGERGENGDSENSFTYAYMLCNVSTDHVGLIGMASGNRWDEPMKVSILRNTKYNRLGITKKDLKRMRGSYRFTRIPKPYELRKYNNSDVE